MITIGKLLIFKVSINWYIYIFKKQYITKYITYMWFIYFYNIKSLTLTIVEIQYLMLKYFNKSFIAM